MGKVLNIELSDSVYGDVVKEAKSLDRSVRKMVSILVERGLKQESQPQPQTPVYQPQPYVYDWHNDPLARPQWQVAEIERLNKEKITRVNELRKANDMEMESCMNQKGWTQEELENINRKYNQKIADVEKEIDEKLDAIYNN